MSFEHNLRYLAKSNFWQTLYRSSKEITGINLFDNISNFSGLQVIFLYWLKVYDMLYTELSQKEWDNLSEKVIQDNYRCDAFLYWRSKQIEKKILDYKKTEKQNRKNPHVKHHQIYKGPQNKEEQ